MSRWNPIARIRTALRTHLDGQRALLDAQQETTVALQEATRHLADLRAGQRALLDAQQETTVALQEATRHLADLRAGQTSVIDDLLAMRRVLDAVRYDVSHARVTAYTTRMSEILGADGRYADAKSLSRHHASVYSQTGEDGIVAEIFRRIGRRDRTFVEIGIGNGQENTTRFLVETGWRGTWVEASGDGVAAARSFMSDYVTEGRLKIVDTFVTAENINAVLDDAGVPATFDYLSLDIDYNTSHVWARMNRRARVACIEYNAHIPPSIPMSVPYDPHGTWDGSHWFGASLKTLERIGATKGLALVGCDLMGVNAFFVASEEAVGRFREPFDAETHFEPPRFHILGTPSPFAPSRPRAWTVED